MVLLAERGTGQSLDILGTLAVLVIVGALVPVFFHRRIGGPRGGSEKAIVPALWLLAAILAGVLLATR